MTNSNAIQSQRPKHIPEYAEACLQSLATGKLGEKISLGGAFGLLHYLDYRSTHDVYAWCAPMITAEDRRRVINVLETALEPFGQVKICAWGDVVSVELMQAGKTVFSFQGAHRSAQLEPSSLAEWTGVLLDNFPDLLASKMVALVERGAPRDFRDIYALCQAGLTTPQQCWKLWMRRQRLAGSDTDSDSVRLAIETHMARVVQHRPLARIEDPEKRMEAQQLRAWFAKEFLDELTEQSDRDWLDGALYPDMDPPEELHALAEQADFLARLCSAWDFGLFPNPETVTEIRQTEWREAVDTCRLLTSPTYHLLRNWHGLPPLPYLGQQLAYIRNDPSLEYV